MSHIRQEITIFSYPEIIDFTTVSDDLSYTAIEIFQALTSPSTVFQRLEIHPTILESLNIRYAEKQVRGIDENFSEYNRNVKLRNVYPRFLRPPTRSYLTEKVFSGDVSGDIGESIFVYLLTMALNVNANFIGHLRPDKLRHRLTPDFIIWEQNTRLTSFLGQYNLPLYAEVKSSTGLLDSKRIASGLDQLKTVMISLPNSHGLLFLLYRIPGNTYNAFLVGVKS